MNHNFDRSLTDSLGRRYVIPSPRRRLQKRLLRVENGCLEWQGYRTRLGYGQIGIDRHLVLTHRLAWEIANGPIPDGLIVCHKCDNPPCCDPAHLFVGSKRDNTHDMINKGRGVAPAGLANGRTKLSAEQVQTIRRMSQSGFMNKEIAAMFGVHPAHVSRIINNRRRST